MATTSDVKQFSDAVKGIFNAHAAGELVQDNPSPEVVWEHLCNVNITRPPSRDKDRTILYEQLLKEWNGLSIDDSQRWTQGLKQRLGSVKDVDDFFDWRRNRILLKRPDFDRLAPRDFAKLLGKAKWTPDDLATQIVTGRLWYGSIGDKVDYFLGWDQSSGESGILCLKLNAHILDLKETEFDLCVELGISTLLPHMFVGVRYQLDHLLDPDLRSITTYAIVLGELFFFPAIRTTDSPGYQPTKQPKSTGQLLAYELCVLHGLPRFFTLCKPTTTATDREDIQVAMLFDQAAGTRISRHNLWHPDLPEAKKQWGIPDITWKVLSYKEPEFAEVGLRAASNGYIAMFPRKE